MFFLHQKVLWLHQSCNTPAKVSSIWHTWSRVAMVQEYLSSRRQSVSCNGTNSGICHISTGVPQGSTLGPFLFLIFMNDIPQLFHSDCLPQWIHQGLGILSDLTIWPPIRKLSKLTLVWQMVLAGHLWASHCGDEIIASLTIYIIVDKFIHGVGDTLSNKHQKSSRMMALYSYNWTWRIRVRLIWIRFVCPIHSKKNVTSTTIS